MQKILYVYDDVFLEHDTGSHPENARRLTAINIGLQRSGILENVVQVKPIQATRQDIQRIHTEQYISRVENVISSGLGYLDPDTVVCDRSLEAALFAAGAGIIAADKIITEGFNRAFNGQFVNLLGHILFTGLRPS